MKKMRWVAMSMLVALGISPLHAFASSGLPKMDIPKLPPLETPQLSDNYDDMLKELEKEGFGQHQWDKDKPLPLPDVEAPAGTGKSAKDKFDEEFGDMWNSSKHQLDSSSVIPKGLEKEVTDYTTQIRAIVTATQAADRSKMKAALNNHLSSQVSLFNLDDIKQGFDEKSLANDMLAKFLADTPKPDGWDKIIEDVHKPQEEVQESVDKMKEFVAQNVPELPSIEGDDFGGFIDGAKDFLSDAFLGYSVFGFNKAKRDAEFANSNAITKDKKTLKELEAQAKAEKEQYGETSQETLDQIKEVSESINAKKKKENWLHFSYRKLDEWLSW